MNLCKQEVASVQGRRQKVGRRKFLIGGGSSKWQKLMGMSNITILETPRQRMPSCTSRVPPSFMVGSMYFTTTYYLPFGFYYANNIEMHYEINIADIA